MSNLVSQLAELTRYRDRDRADALLIGTLQQLLQPRMLALHRCVGEGPHQRWMSCVSRDGCSAPSQRRPPFEQWPRLQDQPAWMDCLQHHQTILQQGTPPVALFPLLVGTQAVGVLELQCTTAVDESTSATVQAVLLLYGNFMGLLDYGERDALTGLLNRKTFDDTLMRTVAGEGGASGHRDAGRAPAPSCYWLAMLDIDHFKRINDTFGHLIGDEVLLLLAGIMRQCFRFGDQLFRFGGEEFVVLLNAPDENGATTALQRLRSQVEHCEFPQVGRVTLSSGFTAVRSDDMPVDAVDRADRALYLAKTSGRNRVVGPREMAAAGMPEAPSHRGAVDLF